MNLLLLPDWLAGDNSKLVLFAVAVAALFIIMRLIARRSESAHNLPPHSFGSAEQLGEIPAPEAPTVHPAMRFESIDLRSFYMREFDVMTGPPDPFEFVDELVAEVEHLHTGNRSTWEFTIGTPSGFARLLELKNWESFYSPQMFVIRKYELELVREMIVEHISAELSQKPGGPSKNEPH